MNDNDQKLRRAQDDAAGATTIALGEYFRGYLTFSELRDKVLRSFARVDPRSLEQLAIDLEIPVVTETELREERGDLRVQFHKIGLSSDQAIDEFVRKAPCSNELAQRWIEVSAMLGVEATSEEGRLQAAQKLVTQREEWLEQLKDRRVRVTRAVVYEGPAHTVYGVLTRSLQVGLHEQRFFPRSGKEPAEPYTITVVEDPNPKILE